MKPLSPGRLLFLAALLGLAPAARAQTYRQGEYHTGDGKSFIQKSDAQQHQRNQEAEALQKILVRPKSANEGVRPGNEGSYVSESELKEVKANTAVRTEKTMNHQKAKAVLAKIRSGKKPAQEEVDKLETSIGMYPDGQGQADGAAALALTGNTILFSSTLDRVDRAELCNSGFLAVPDVPASDKIRVLRPLVQLTPVKPTGYNPKRPWSIKAFEFLKDVDSPAADSLIVKTLEIMQEDGFTLAYEGTGGSITNKAGSAWIKGVLSKGGTKVETTTLAKEMGDMLTIIDYRVRLGEGKAEKLKAMARAAGYRPGDNVNCDLPLALAYASENKLDSAGMFLAGAWPRFREFKEASYKPHRDILHMAKDALPYAGRYDYWAEACHMLNSTLPAEVPLEAIALACNRQFMEAKALLDDYRPKDPSEELKAQEAEATLDFLTGDYAKAYKSYQKAQKKGGLLTKSMATTYYQVAGQKTGSGTEKAPFYKDDLHPTVPDWVRKDIEGLFTK